MASSRRGGRPLNKWTAASDELLRVLVNLFEVVTIIVRCPEFREMNQANVSKLTFLHPITSIGI